MFPGVKFIGNYEYHIYISLLGICYSKKQRFLQGGEGTCYFFQIVVGKFEG